MIDLAVEGSAHPVHSAPGHPQHSNGFVHYYEETDPAKALHLLEDEMVRLHQESWHLAIQWASRIQMRSWIGMCQSLPLWHGGLCSHAPLDVDRPAPGPAGQWMSTLLMLQPGLPPLCHALVCQSASDISSCGFSVAAHASEACQGPMAELSCRCGQSRQAMGPSPGCWSESALLRCAQGIHQMHSKAWQDLAGATAAWQSLTRGCLSLWCLNPIVISHPEVCGAISFGCLEQRWVGSLLDLPADILPVCLLVC